MVNRMRLLIVTCLILICGCATKITNQPAPEGKSKQAITKQSPPPPVPLSGPGWNTVVDLAPFVDPVNPNDDTVPQAIGGMFQGAPYNQLLTQVLASPDRRSAFDTLNAYFSKFPKRSGPSEPKPEDLKRLTGEAGNDVLFIGHTDPQKSIDGGAGTNLGVIAGDKGVTLNLAKARLRAVLGGSGGDILVGGGLSTVMIDGGPSDDIILGGNANDLLVGGDGDDLIDSRDGNDLMHGGVGNDRLTGRAGSDVLYGGPGDDQLSGGEENDFLSGDDGDDTLDGGNGTDIAAYGSTLANYRLFRIDPHTWRMAYSRFGGDGSDMLHNIERLSFADWWRVPLDRSAPIPVDDTVVGREIDKIVSHHGLSLTRAYLILGERLIANDLSLSAKKIRPQALIDANGKEVRPETWAEVGGGQALLTAAGNVICKHIGIPGPMIFRYRIGDLAGNRGAIAERAGTTGGEEMWAKVVLVGKDPAVAAASRRECSESCTLDPGEVELVLTGKESANGTGNDLANTLIGNAAGNILDGGPGLDLMQGGPGNDSFFVDNPGDQVIEEPNKGLDAEGFDTVWSSVEGYTLPANVEHLILGPDVRDGRGNDLDNFLQGNDRDNMLEGGPAKDMINGGKGADRMSGGPDDDVYVVDNSGDQVIELPHEGSQDTARSEISRTLPANVENLTLTGRGDIDGMGNDLDNQLTGNAGANVLKGGPGNDSLNGVAGDDTLDGGSGNNVYLITPSSGHDTIIEEDPTPGKMATLRLLARKPESFRFWRQDEDLNVRSVNGKEWVTIRDWYRGTEHRVERIEADGRLLLPEGVDALVKAMNELALPVDGKEIPAEEFEKKFVSLIKEVWHKDTSFSTAPPPSKR